MRKPKCIKLYTLDFEQRLFVAYDRHDKIIAEFAVKQHDHVPERVLAMFNRLNTRDYSSEQFWQAWEEEASHNRI